MSLSRQDATIWEDNTEGVSSAFSSSNGNTTTNTITTVSSSSSLADQDDASSDEGSAHQNHEDGEEGSPTSRQSSFDCDEIMLCATLQATAAPFVPPEGFTDMVLKQRQERKLDNAQKRASWVATMQTEMYAMLPGELRLPALIAESYRHEVTFVRKNQAHLTEVQVQDLLADTKRSYQSIFAEVMRAVKSHPPAQQDVSVEQHRQNVAQSGVQCFAAMLPYSNGVCGAITDARRAHHSTHSGIPQHILLDDGFHTLHASPATPSANPKCPKGTAVGKTGRFIPISMSADHGKGDKVSAVRRENLANKLNRGGSPTKAQQQGYRTPNFARQRMPNHGGSQYRRGCGSHGQSGAKDGHSYRPTRHVDPVASH